MSGKVTVKQTTFKTGTTKIAVPITDVTSDQVMASARAIKATKPDVVEWRLDFFDAVPNDRLAIKKNGTQIKEGSGKNRSLNYLQDVP